MNALTQILLAATHTVLAAVALGSVVFIAAPAAAADESIAQDVKSVDSGIINPSSPPPAKSAAQTRAAMCDQLAKEKTGGVRDTFLSACLKGDIVQSDEGVAPPPVPARNCAKAPKDMKGDRLTDFMRTCFQDNRPTEGVGR